MLVNHDNASYEYVLDYFAHLIQKPGELPGVALLFRSEKEGVGKNLMFEHFFGYNIVGSKYILQTTDIDKVLGRFSMINNKLLVILDEAKGKDTFLNNEKIKNFITTNKIAWERKGVDGFTINNFARMLFFSNGKTPVSIPFGDRRFACFNSSNKQANNRKYFKTLLKSMRDETVIKNFYNFLLHRDISEFDIVSDRPETDFYRELQSESIPSIARFLIDYIDNDSNENKILAKQFYSAFKTWCQDTNRNNLNYTNTRFGREVNSFDGIIKKRFNDGNKYILDFEVIKQDMINRKYVTKCEFTVESDTDTDTDT